MVSAINVGNNLLKRGFSENIDITPMKLQKLIYLVYKKYYQDTDITLFSERFEVWKYGPVIRSVYDEFKEYRSNAIKRYARENDGAVLIVDEEKSTNFTLALDYVWDKYKMYDGIPLSAMTHKQGTAWWKAVKENLPYLRDEDIKTEEVFVS